MKHIKLPERLQAELERLSEVTPRLEVFSREAPVLVAVSGGRDSVALLHLAHQIGLQIAVAHLDHGIREGSSDDEAFVRDLCASLSVPFHTERVDVPVIAKKRGWGIEEAARTLRYAFLTRTAQRLDASAILTAHTQDDNAETLVMQLLRGTARATGIPARRDRILRPLLGVARAELEAFLLERKLTWREDPTNRDTHYNRNWVRLEVMPLLETRYPGAINALARYTQVSRDEDALLEELANLVPSWASWRDQAVPVQRRLIRRLLEAARVRTDLGHIEALRESLERPTSSAPLRVSLPEDHTGLVQDGRVYIFDGQKQLKSAPPPGVSLRPHEMPDDLDFSAFPQAELRTWQPGDRIRRSGGTRKLTDVLADRRVPQEMRERVPIVAQHNEVLWVGFEPSITDIRISQVRDLESEAMTEAIRLAREAFEDGEVPVGAVVLRGKDIVGRGRNRSRAKHDMTMHAELEAIRDAAQRLKTPYLSDCRLIVTLEPCPMCLGAALEARVPRIAFGATNDRSGALGGVNGSLRAPWLALHQLDVRPHLRAKECSTLLSAFFERVRQDRADTLETP
jgi:tRNA(Ile)-lysidine synthase